MADGLTIAVLGAGMQGTTVALELVRRGCRVDLFDCAEQPITRSGLQNEGKLHLGFVYGKDRSHRTIDRLAAGSLRFLPLIQRWAGAGIDKMRLSRPYIYAVPRDSMLPPEAIEKHFQRVEESVQRLVVHSDAERGDIAYPGWTSESLFRPLSEAQRHRWFSADTIVAAFATNEVAVDPRSIAAILRLEVAAHPRIQFLPGVQVEEITPKGTRFTVITTPDVNSSSRVYDHVVNALWEGRLRLDQKMGLVPDRPWLWRHKVGFRMALGDETPEITSVTFVLGSYGDIVQYQDGDVYLCWYSAGLVGLSSDLSPPERWNELRDTRRAARVAATFDGFSRLYPDVRRLRPMAGSNLSITGGVIFAWGETDIDDPDSELHMRYDLGVTSRDGYHTVNTGKYCMAPVLAMDVADRIVVDPTRAPA